MVRKLVLQFCDTPSKSYDFLKSLSFSKSKMDSEGGVFMENL